jgi:multiple sugar transport system permease protein
MKTRSSILNIVLVLVAFAVVLVWLLPFYWAISVSLRPPSMTFTCPGLCIPGLQFSPTLEHWRSELGSREMRNALLTSTVIAFAASFFTLVLGTPAAYALARFQFRPRLMVIFAFIFCAILAFTAATFGVDWRLAILAAFVIFLGFAMTLGKHFERRLGNEDITLWFLSQRFLPPVVTVVPFLLIMSQLKLVDTRLALILVNITFNIPFAIVIMRQAFIDLPVELEEAAMVDGASFFGAFSRIALRLAAPVMAATLMIILAFCWNELLFSLNLGTLKAKTVPALLAGSSSTRGIQFWFVAVRALIALIPPTILALLAQRYIVGGLTFGAVKG